MKTRSAYLALVAVALSALAGGVAFLFALQPVRAPLGKTVMASVTAPKKIAPPAPTPEGDTVRDSAEIAGSRSGLFGLRTAIAPPTASVGSVQTPPAARETAPMAPMEPMEPMAPMASAPPTIAGLAVTTALDPSKPPQPGATEDAEEFEGDITSLDAGPPRPPARPAALTESSPAPSPPRRPINLEALAALESAPPTDGSAPDATDQPGLRPLGLPGPAGPAAPLPPARPRDLAGLPAAAVAPSVAPAANVEATNGQQSARLPEPTLQPAPDDAFQAAPPKFGMGDPVFVRIFKQEGQLELWLKKSGRFHLYKTFPVCKWSGRLGPKVKEADYQSPEGFYSVSSRQLNPHSNYYRAFNVGYPNAFDKQNGRTGGLVMVHGACKSVGCFAMTDRGIEEIYGFVEAALRAGQRDIPVHIFPFRMTDANIARETGGGWLAFVGGPSYAQWNGFWRNLKEGYDLFEQTGEPPTAFACGDHYEFGASAKSCRRIAGW